MSPKVSRNNPMPKIHFETKSKDRTTIKMSTPLLCNKTGLRADDTTTTTVTSKLVNSRTMVYLGVME